MDFFFQVEAYHETCFVDCWYRCLCAVERHSRIGGLGDRYVCKRSARLYASLFHHGRRVVLRNGHFELWRVGCGLSELWRIRGKQDVVQRAQLRNRHGFE